MGEWKDVVLGESAEVCLGKMLDQHKNKGQYLPYLANTNVQWGRFELDGLRRMRFQAHEHERYGLKRGDIVMCEGGEPGRCAMWRDEAAAMMFQKALHRIRPFNGMDSLFLYYRLFESGRIGAYEPLLTGTTIKHLPRQNLLQFRFRSPPLPIQRRIAHILGTLDDKIELNQRTNRTLEKMAAALFKSWFIDFDPVRRNAARAQNQPSPRPDGNPSLTGRGAGGEGVDESNAFDHLFPDNFEDSDLGPIPKGWKSGSLGDVADSPRRGVNPSDVPPTTPYIGLEHMPRRCIALDTWGRAEDVASGKSRFKQGEIMFGKLRPYFHKVGIAPMDGVCSTDIVVVTPKTQAWHGYIVSLVSSKAFVDYTDSHSAGTKMPRTNWKDMSLCRTMKWPSTTLWLKTRAPSRSSAMRNSVSWPRSWSTG